MTRRRHPIIEDRDAEARAYVLAWRMVLRFIAWAVVVGLLALCLLSGIAAGLAELAVEASR